MSSEHDEQVALFRWASLAACQFPALRWLFAIPNGGLRHPAVAVRMVAEGLKAGVPDVFLPLPRYLDDGDCLHGLFIELKVGRNKPSDKQQEWLAALNNTGYLAVVCYGWQDAARVILGYLDVDEVTTAQLLGEPWNASPCPQEGRREEKRG